MLPRTRHDRRTFIDKWPIVTASGNLYRVVTPLAVFRKEDGSLVVDTIHLYSSYEEVRENMGFPVSPPPFTSPPTEEELDLIQEFDPERVREIEFSG